MAFTFFDYCVSMDAKCQMVVALNKTGNEHPLNRIIFDTAVHSKQLDGSVTVYTQILQHRWDSCRFP